MEIKLELGKSVLYDKVFTALRKLKYYLDYKEFGIVDLEDYKVDLVNKINYEYCKKKVHHN